MSDLQRRLACALGIGGLLALSMGTGALPVQATVKQPSTTTLASSGNPSTFGTSVTFTATVTTTGATRPTGTVQFMEGASPLLGSAPVAVSCCAPHSGTATFTTSTLSPGVHHLSAAYNGDANVTSSSGPLDQIVGGLQISPASASVATGTAQVYTAHLINSSGTDLGDVTALTTFVITPDGVCTGASCRATVVGAHTVTGTDALATGQAALTVTPGPLDHLVLSPAGATIAAGGSHAYTAEGFDASGNDLGDVTASTTFGIGPDGSCTVATCTATTAGTHTVTGSDGGAQGSATLTVGHGTLDHLALTPASASITSGGGRTYLAQGFDQYDNSLGDVTASTSFGIAPDGSCLVSTCTAGKAGSHTVTGTDGTATGTAALTVTAGPLDHLSLSPASATVVAGGSQAYTAEGFDAAGNDLGDVTAATTFGIADAKGSCTAATCTGTTAGDHTVTGTDGGASGTATLSVTSGPLDHLTLSPAGATVVAGGSQAYTAEGFDASGNDLGNVTSSTTFTIDDPRSACVGATCAAATAGSHTVTGTDGAASGTATLTVIAGPLDHLVLSPAGATVVAGGSQAYTAEGLDLLGNDLGDVTADTTFTIDDAKGSCTAATCTGATAGDHTVTGTDGSASGSATLSVTSGPLDHLSLSPASATVVAGGSQAYTAEGFDASGNDLGDVTAATTFTIADAKGSCTAATCTGATAGTHTVTGTDGSATGTAALVVTAGPLDHLSLSPASATVIAGGSQAYTAEGLDASGNDLGDVTAATTFTIADAKGSCTAATCTGATAGTHTVTGTDGSATGTAALVVTAGPLDHLSLSPASATVVAGGSQAYTAEGLDASGNDLGDVTAATTFTIADAKGSCTAATCTGATAGTHTVTGTDGSATGTAALVVTAGPLDHLTLSPAGATVVAGGSQAYTVEGFDASGNDLGDVTAATTFTIADAKGSCTAATCTGATAGTDTVTGTDGSATGTAALVVTAGPLDHLTLSPAGATVVAGGSQAYTAEGFDASGNDLGNVTPGTTFTIDDPKASCTAATCTGGAAGTDTVTGTDGAATGTAALTVTADTVVVTPHSHTLAASGAAHTTVTAVVSNTSGPASGDTVTFTSNPVGAVTFGAVTYQSGSATGSDGTATVTMTSGTHAGTVTITATEGTGNALGVATEKLKSTHFQSASLAQSAISADGTSQTTATVVAVDGSNSPVAGETVTFGDTDSNGATVTPSAVTDSNGTATATVKSSQKAGTYTITASSTNPDAVVNPAAAGTYAADLTLTQLGTNTDFIHAAYLTMLGHDADPTGFAFWLNLLNSGTPRSVLSLALANTPEYRHNVISGNGVNDFYQLYLDRTGEAAGIDYWVGRMAGIGGPRLTFEQVRLEFVNSVEYFSSQLVGNNSKAATIQALYDDLLGRTDGGASDPTGTAYWMSHYNPSLIASQFLFSPEGRAFLVNTLYQQILNRNAEPGGLAFWTNALLSGASDENIIASILSSDEYFNSH